MGILKGKKTYITAALAVIGAVAGFLTGDLELGNAINIAVTAVLAAFVRNGVSNS